MQARFPAGRVRISGRSKEYTRTSDQGDLRVHNFCPECGGTVYFSSPDDADRIAIPVDAFSDPGFPPPRVEVYSWQRHPWVRLPDGIESDEAWGSLLPLYEAGDYAAAAERGVALVGEHPENAELAYNVACCASLAGRADDAVALLRRAVDLDHALRPIAAGDSDFAALADVAAFRQLVSGAPH
jgi:glutathione-dependent formaldehyde-activating enzyme/tetratricopeptide repeat protein